MIFLWSTVAVSQEENLKSECSKGDFQACENLTAFYIKIEQWDNALMLGDVLCKKDKILGCTFAGTALMAKGKVKEGVSSLAKACDGFEPYACRSLARLMKKNNDEAMTYMFMKRACHYGLNNLCREAKKPKSLYSKAAQEMLSNISQDCSDTEALACQEHISKLESCSEPLTKKDCQLLPGELSILFRAKLMQAEAKLSLMAVGASEKSLKEASKKKSFSYDLQKVLKDYTPLKNYRYIFGFMDACSRKFKSRKSVTNDSHELFRGAYKELSARTIANINAYFKKGKVNDCHDQKYGFEAFAVANLDPMNPTRLDVWKINSDSDIIHIQDGLPLP